MACKNSLDLMCNHKKRTRNYLQKIKTNIKFNTIKMSTRKKQHQNRMFQFFFHRCHSMNILCMTTKRHAVYILILILSLSLTSSSNRLWENFHSLSLTPLRQNCNCRFTYKSTWSWEMEQREGGCEMEESS